MVLSQRAFSPAHGVQWAGLTSARGQPSPPATGTLRGSFCGSTVRSRCMVSRKDVNTQRTRLFTE
jgi:hypothetical protein